MLKQILKNKIVLLFFLFHLSVLNSYFLNAQNITGTEFWFSMPTQQGGPFTDEIHQIFIASDYDGTATIEYIRRRPPYKATADGNSIFTISFTAGITATALLSNATNVSLTHSDKEANTETIQPNGFRITSTQPIVAYVLNNVVASAETSPIYPTVMLGNDYIVTAYRENFVPNSNNFPSFFTIIGTQDNTTISITLPPGTAAKTKAAGSTWTITLGAGQTYSVFAKNQLGANWSGNTGTNLGLTGSRVNANKPIAVIGGASCTQVGAQQYRSVATFCGACDIMFSQLTPTSYWGTEYIALQTIRRGFNVMTTNTNSDGYTSNQRSIADYIEFVAKENGTIINISGVGTEQLSSMNGTKMITMDAFQRKRYEVPGDFAGGKKAEANLHIVSNKPISVTQLSKGYGCDNFAAADPSAIYNLPVTTWIDKYITTTPVGAGFTFNYAGFVIKGAANTGSLTFDGAPVGAAGWTEIGTSDYFFKHIDIGPGTHKSIASAPFGIYMAGGGDATSYSYSGGGPHLLAVPIELATFNATLIVDKVNVTWSTASEINNDYFEVEKSMDGTTYNRLGSAEGGINSAVTKSYSLIDPAPAKGINYYRLKQVDTDGKFSYSGIKSVEYKTDNFFEMVSLQPNPVINELKLSFVSGSENIVSFQIIDLVGREIINGNLTEVKPGNNEVLINTSKLDKGIYYLMLKQQDSEALIQTKLVKN